MSEFFSWSTLATYAGAVLAVTLITQLIKGAGFIAKIPTRLVSYVIALLVLIAATYFTSVLTVESAGLCAINAVVISLAANGGFDAVKGTTTSIKKE